MVGHVPHLGYVTGFLEIVSVWMSVCVCLPLRILITSGVIWTQYDWLNKFYNFYMTAIVTIISRCGLTIEACHSNQSNKSKLALYKPLLHCNRHLKQLYIKVTRWYTSVIKVGVVYMGVHILRHLKEELVWAIDEWFWVICSLQQSYH